MTEFPSDEPAAHPTGFPVESEPDARPDPETEPGGGEPDFDSEPDRTADSATHLPNNPTPFEDRERVNDGAGVLGDGVAGSVVDEVDESPEAVASGADVVGVASDVVSDGADEGDGVRGAAAGEVGGDGEAEENGPEETGPEHRVVSGEDGERGHPLVEETGKRLEDLRGRPVSEHAEIYADVHERLQSALAEAERPDAQERV